MNNILKISRRNKLLLQFDVLLGLLLCTVLITTALAIPIASSATKNQFTVGNNYSEIAEEYEPPAVLEADKSYTKKVAVSNCNDSRATNKTVPCYVRLFAEVEDPDVASRLEIDFNSSDWTNKQSDGYYYYKKVLNPGETTSPLFTTLSAKEDISDFAMICYSESVQCEGFEDAATAFKAIGGRY